MKQNVARWHACNPGPTCDKYYAKHPEDLKYLSDARTEIIHECVQLALDGDARKVRGYVEGHKEREWMINAAIAAVKFTRQGEGLDEYYKSYPREQVFLQAAREMKGDHSELVSSPTLRENLTPPPPSEAVGGAKHAQSHLDSPSPERNSAPISVVEAAKSVEAMLKAQDGNLPATPAAAVESPPGTPAAAVDSPPPTPATAVESGTSAGSEAHTKENGFPQATPPGVTGLLTALFFNVAGDFTLVHREALKAPIAVQVQFRALTQSVSPRDVVHSLEALAASMSNLGTDPASSDSDEEL